MRGRSQRVNRSSSRRLLSGDTLTPRSSPVSSQRPTSKCNLLSLALELVKCLQTLVPEPDPSLHLLLGYPLARDDPCLEGGSSVDLGFG